MLRAPFWLQLTLGAFFLLIGTACACGSTQRAERTASQIESPDGELHAELIAIAPNTDYGGKESRVEIRDRSGKLVTLKDFSSPDSNHGELAEGAAWTPDSQFFVLMLYHRGDIRRGSRRFGSTREKTMVCTSYRDCLAIGRFCRARDRRLKSSRLTRSRSQPGNTPASNQETRTP